MSAASPRDAGPIAARLERIASQWQAFADDGDARALHWLIEPDEWRIVDTFLALESRDTAETDDAFVLLDEPFRHADFHGLALHRWLVRKYEESSEQLAEAGATLGWQPPDPLAEDDVGTVLASLESLWLHHQPFVRHLVAVLVPTRISSARAWTEWVARLVARLDHEHVRIVVLDYRDTALFAPLALAHADRVRTSIAALDMPTAYLELSARAGGLDTPQGVFRHAFVQMSVALAKGHGEAADRHAQLAVSVARKQGWGHLEFAIAFAQGSGRLSARDHAGAIRCYREAERIAAVVQAAGESFGLGLRLKARMAMGASCVAAGTFALAARTYEEARPLADELGDTRMQLECWRMAAYCHEQDKKTDLAWTCGMQALAIGGLMKQDERESSTLAVVGELLLRLASGARRVGSGPAIEGRMRELVGPEWRRLARATEAHH